MNRMKSNQIRPKKESRASKS